MIVISSVDGKLGCVPAAFVREFLMTIKFEPALALREHMLEGNPVTLLEAILLFGVQGPNAEFARMKKDGLFVKNRRIPMAKALRRINDFAVCKPPENLPSHEIFLTEYFVSK